MSRDSLFDLTRALILAIIVLPLLMVACVGAYGFIVWLLQMFVIGLPTA
ncbi:periplasmic nitrate reductase, NapE protein [Gallibacterium salpingitidis]|uniref:Nitrate/trimethylamine N-oxide reductase NapE/TorE n=1 Tax=Gallibacterium salpingitidis TaxID=505341 RepID=A0A1A7NT08_9PAST|nr:nitrate/trimethylamine N-oxide reductase NapE/TorE [Gallibacterium salpingitidis]OBW93362.1 nitrate/trimethylamine N-oxide reductase NapE/TorE [Gallibacterium salpingitidis]